MTKKSNNRKFKLGQTPQRYRGLTLDVPMEMYSRILENMVKTIEKGLIDPKMPPSEFILIVLANGIGMMEADLLNRERQTRLVLSPDEMATTQPRVTQRLPV